MVGLFKKIGRTRRIPEKLAQYDDEYLLYCVEKDRVETVLESTLHETDDPKEIIDVTLKTVCEFYGGDWAGVMDCCRRANLSENRRANLSRTAELNCPKSVELICHKTAEQPS